MLSKHLLGTAALNSPTSLTLPHGLKITLARDPALNNLSHNCRAKIYLTQKSGQSLNLLTYILEKSQTPEQRYKQITDCGQLVLAEEGYSVNPFPLRC